MPTYQYRCTECDHAFEQVQSFTDDALTVCPACQGRLRKVFAAVGVVFKGSGFYRNDSRDASKSGSTAPAAAKQGDGSSTDGGSKESAPAAASKDGGSGTSTSTASTSTTSKKDSTSAA